MIDGADNNDDVVGGPLQNVTQEAVQEFQIATNRFSAESGRSAASAINIITKSGTDQFRAPRRCSCATTAGRRSRRSTMVDGRHAVRSPAARRLPPVGRWRSSSLVCAPPSIATRMAPSSVGRATSRRGPSGSPSRRRRSTICSARRASTGGRMPSMASRSDMPPSARTIPAASTLDRAIGSASQRQASENRYQSAVGSWTRIWTPTLVNVTTASFSTFKNTINPLASGPQLTFPSIQDGSSFRVPQGTTQKRFQLADSLTLVRGRAHDPHRWRVAERARPLRPRRLPPGTHRVRRGLRQLRSQR